MVTNNKSKSLLSIGYIMGWQWWKKKVFDQFTPSKKHIARNTIESKWES